MSLIKTYSELITLPTFEERFRYLKLDSVVGEDTFGFDRYLNQVFYNSQEWKDIREFVIMRDNACDLAMPDRAIRGRILVHHMNPVSKDDIVKRSKFLLDPEYLICTYKNTHDAIHFSDEKILFSNPIERTPNDTCPWRR